MPEPPPPGQHQRAPTGGDNREVNERLRVYRDLFESVPVGIYRTTPEPDGRFLEVNPAMLEFFEAASEAELLATPVRTLYTDPDQRRQISDQLLAHGQVIGVELRMNTLRGRSVWVRISVRRSADERGNTVFDGLIEDIDERVRGEHFQRHLLNSLAVGVAGLDTEGRFTFLNPTGCRLFGFADEQEVLGRNAHGLTHHSHADGSPYPDTECPLYRILETGRPLEAWEDLFWRQDGSAFPVLVYAAPVRGDDSEPLGIVVSFQDITERQRTQRERDRMLEILDDHPHFVQRLLPDGTVVFANRAIAELLGTTPQALVGRQWQAAIPAEERSALKINLAGLHPQAATRTVQHSVADASGAVRWIEWSLRAFFTPDGTTTHIQAVGVDITERKAAERARNQAESDRRTFLAAVSHDLRTPLNAMIGFTELLSRSALNPEQHRYLEMCRAAGSRLLALTETLLDLSRLEAGRLTLHCAPFALGELVTQQVALLRAQAEEKGIELTLHLDPALPESVNGDATRFGQVLFNLAVNAVKFTEHGAVHIAVESLSGERVRVAVSDTGPGVAREEQQRIFDAFVQSGTADAVRQGTGLGLKICWELVEIMAGEIGVESSPGTGSTFHFTVPLPSAAPATSPSPPAGEQRQRRPNRSAAPPQCGQGLHVLIAEDEPVNALLLRRLLEDAGCSVTEVDNGAAAVTAWQQNRPDLILLDVQMPQMNGPQATAEIRRLEAEDARKPRTPIAVLTAHALQDVRDTCLEVGCDGYLTKPIDVDALHQLLHTVRTQRSDEERR